MPANYVLLEKVVVGATPVSSITFSSIPQTGYTDLVIKTSTRQTANTNREPFFLRFNGSTTNYSSRMIQGEGGTGSAASYTNVFGITNGLPLGASPTAGQTASTFSSGEFYIPNYTSSNFKSVSADNSSETNTTTDFQWAEWLTAGLWSDTAAITSISIFAYTPSSDTFAQGSSFYLYGVAKLGTTPAIQPYATGGDTIMTDGTYWYHTFLSSGTFTPAKALSCDYLVVAGGGGGGAAGGGGGGAGGLRSTVTATGGGGTLETALSLGTSAYTVTIGAGGTQSSSYGVSGTNGSNSVFATITSTGGGGGAGYNNLAVSGGSGGGGTAGGVVSAPRYTGAAGTANQGYAGGNGNTSPANAGGGGGGAGAVGGNAVAANTGMGGNGGAGVAVAITGTSVTYAGGGGGGGASGTPPGGGTGGAGGGGNGGYGGAGVPTAGTANRGGGGGGDWNNVSTAGSGGSGIVIVRYAV